MQGKANFTYSEHIHPKRFPVPSPEAIVKDGKSVFGAFEGAIKNLNIDEAKRPLGIPVPRFINNLRVKEWEAYEVSFDEGFLCGAIYDLGPAVFNIMMFYDAKNKKVYANQIFGAPRKCAKNSLINSTNSLKTGDFKATIENHFENGTVFIKSSYAPKDESKIPMSADLLFRNEAPGGVTVMPLGENRPLYTHKGFFKAEGTISIGDRTFVLNENATGIIDDHKGYYNLKMHYDWVTCMGVKDGVALGVNLCKNQATDPEKYCENILWYNGSLHLLPTVDFEHLPDGNWHVYDKYGEVDLTFHIDDSYKLNTEVLMVKANYHAPFGVVKGYVKGAEGKKISLDGLYGMGEDICYHNI